MRKEILERLQALFLKNKVLDMEQLLEAIHVTSKRTAFRYLQNLGCYTSYTHMGKYYTLPSVAQFDDFGLWHYKDIGFSSHGTLIDTLQWVITTSKAGKTNSELESLFKIRVQNSLQKLLKPKRIANTKPQKSILYISSDPAIGRQQVENRLKTGEKKTLPSWIVAEVLIATIQSFSFPPNMNGVMKVLKKRDSLITYEQVKQVFEEEGLEKKTPD